MTAKTSRAFDQLHILLEQLQKAEQMLALGPKRIAVAEKKVAAAQQDAAAQKEQIQQLKKTADEGTLNLKVSEAEVAKHKLRLNEAGSNKEYQIIQGQIQAAQGRTETLEDEVLELLANVDAANSRLAELDQEIAEKQANVKTITEEVSSRKPGLTADVERLTAEISAAESVIPGGESMATYRRLREAMGASAMARVEDSYCTECNTGATPQDVVRMNMGEFVLCRACGRILYAQADS